MEDTVSTNPKQEENADSSIKTRLANLLINRVALSECLNVIRDACIQRAAEIVEGADEEQMSKILADLEVFENPPKEDAPEGPSGLQQPLSEAQEGSPELPEVTPIKV